MIDYDDVSKRLKKQYMNALSLMSSQETRKPSKHFYYPSSLNCQRRMVFQRMGEEIDTTKASPGLLERAAYGTSRHSEIQSVLFQMYIHGADFVWTNVEEYIKEHPELDYLEVTPSNDEYETHIFDHKHFLSYRMDALLYDKKTKTYFITDIKTEGDNDYHIQNDVRGKDVRQMWAYCSSMQIPHYIFFYELLGYLSKKIFVDSFTEQDMKDFERFIIETNLNVERKTYPHVYPITSEEQKKLGCQYCPYKKRCAEIEKELGEEL